MPLPPRVLRSEADHVVATWHNAILMRFRDRVRLETIEFSSQVGRQLSDEHGTRIVSVSLVESGTLIPDADVRRRATELMEAAESYMAFQANIITGRGFWNTAARAAMSAMILLSGGGVPNRVFGTVEEAAPEILPYIVADGLTAEGVAKAILGLR